MLPSLPTEAAPPRGCTQLPSPWEAAPGTFQVPHVTSLSCPICATEHHGCLFVPLAVPWLSCLQAGMGCAHGACPPCFVLQCLCWGWRAGSGRPGGDGSRGAPAAPGCVPACAEQQPPTGEHRRGCRWSRAREAHQVSGTRNPLGVRNIVVSAPDSCCSSGAEAAGPALANGAVRASCASWCLQQERSGLHLFPSHSPVVAPAPQGSLGVSLVYSVSHSLAGKELKELQTLLSQSFPGSESKDGKCNFEKEIILCETEDAHGL